MPIPIPNNNGNLRPDKDGLPYPHPITIPNGNARPDIGGQYPNNENDQIRPITGDTNANTGNTNVLPPQPIPDPNPNIHPNPNNGNNANQGGDSLIPDENNSSEGDPDIDVRFGEDSADAAPHPTPSKAKSNQKN